MAFREKCCWEDSWTTIYSLSSFMDICDDIHIFLYYKKGLESLIQYDTNTLHWYFCSVLCTLFKLMIYPAEIFRNYLTNIGGVKSSSSTSFKSHYLPRIYVYYGIWAQHAPKSPLSIKNNFSSPTHHQPAPIGRWISSTSKLSSYHYSPTQGSV